MSQALPYSDLPLSRRISVERDEAGALVITMAGLGWRRALLRTIVYSILTTLALMMILMGGMLTYFWWTGLREVPLHRLIAGFPYRPVLNMGWYLFILTFMISYVVVASHGGQRLVIGPAHIKPPLGKALLRTDIRSVRSTAWKVLARLSSRRLRAELFFAPSIGEARQIALLIRRELGLSDS